MNVSQHRTRIRFANLLDALIFALSLGGLCVLLLTSPQWGAWLDRLGEPVPVMLRECGERTLA